MGVVSHINEDYLNRIVDVAVIRESEVSSDRTTGTNGHCSALLGFKCQAHTLNLLLDVILEFLMMYLVFGD